MLEYGLRSGNYRGGGGGGKGQSKQPKSNERQKRDVREVTKYVETALVLDKAMVRDYNETIALATLIELLNGIFIIFMQLVWEAQRQPTDRSRPGRHSNRQYRRPGQFNSFKLRA